MGARRPPWGKNRKSYEKHSPHKLAGNLGKFKTPMLVIHNDLDFRCPVGQGLELFGSLQRQGVPSRMINFPDEGHWVLKPRNSEYWHQEVRRMVGSGDSKVDGFLSWIEITTCKKPAEARKNRFHFAEKIFTLRRQFIAPRDPDHKVIVKQVSQPVHGPSYCWLAQEKTLRRTRHISLFS